MDLSKSKFEIIKVAGCEDLGHSIIDFFNFVPEKEHLSQIGSGQYSLEEGMAFGCESDEDIEKYEAIMDSFDPEDEAAAYKKLEDEGFVSLGLCTNLKYFKRVKRSDEYLLILRIEGDRVVTIATSDNKKLLQQYKKLIDNKVTRFKLSLIVQDNDTLIGSLEDIYKAAHEDSEYCKGVLNTLDLTE